MSQGPSLRRLAALIEAAAGVIEETDLDRVLRRLVSEARTATGAEYAALGIIGEHGVLSDFLYVGISEELAARIGHLPTGHGVLGTVIRLNKTIRVDEISAHPDSIGFPEHHPPMTAFLGVPVAVGNEAFGNLYLTEKQGGFTVQDAAVAEALSRIAGAAVRTARLHDRLRRVAVVEDRQRIARDLHDSVIQELFAVGLALQGVAHLVDDPHARATFEDAVDRLDGAVESLRGHIFRLRRISDEAPPLGDKVREVVGRMGSAYPATVSLDVGIEATGDEVLDDEILTIVTEALSNALRHSSAVNISVLVDKMGDHHLVSVTDDGVGFDPDSPAAGMGLENIRSRARRLGAELSITTRDGEGTQVLARFPFDRSLR